MHYNRFYRENANFQYSAFYGISSLKWQECKSIRIMISFKASSKCHRTNVILKMAIPRGIHMNLSSRSNKSTCARANFLLNLQGAGYENELPHKYFPIILTLFLTFLSVNYLWTIFQTPCISFTISFIYQYHL